MKTQSKNLINCLVVLLNHWQKKPKHDQLLKMWVEDIHDVEIQFFTTPRIAKIALETLAELLRKGINIQRSINLTIYKVKKILNPDEKFNEKKFIEFIITQVLMKKSPKDTLKRRLPILRHSDLFSGAVVASELLKTFNKNQKKN